MAALEKIYLYPSDRAGEEYEAEWGDKPWGEDCVEYINKTELLAEIERRISLYKAEKAKEDASKVDKISLGARIAMLEEILSFIKQ